MITKVLISMCGSAAADLHLNFFHLQKARISHDAVHMYCNIEHLLSDNGDLVVFKI